MRSETNATLSESREAERSHRGCLDKRGEAPRPAEPLALREKVAVEQPKERARATDGTEEFDGADRACVGTAGAPRAKARKARASAAGRRRPQRLRRGPQAPRKLLRTRLQPPERL